MTRIKSVSIRALRGIKELELDLEEKSSLVYGENGTGKSSIVDALEFFFTGTISHLEGSQELSVKGHGTHAKHKPKDVKVSVEFVGKGMAPSTLTRTFSAEPVVPPHIQDYFSIAQRRAFVLRRSQVVEFIYSKPADRFRAIGKILGTEPLDVIESAFMRAADAFAGQLKAKDEARTAALIAASQALSCVTKISDKDGVLVELNRKLAQKGRPPLQSFEKSQEYESNLLSQVRQTSNIQLSVTMRAIIDAARKVKVEGMLEAKLAQLEGRINGFVQKNAQDRLSFMRLLEEGKKAITGSAANANQNKCPLCGQDIDQSELLGSIDKRLSVLESLTQKASEIRQDLAYAIDKVEGLSLSIGALISQIQVANRGADFAEEVSGLSKASSVLEQLVKEMIDAKESLQSAINASTFSDARDAIEKSVASISAKADTLLEAAEPTAQERELMVIVSTIEQAKARFAEVERIDLELLELRKHVDLSARLFTTYSETKKLKIQEIHNAIQADIEKFYSFLHPGEQHGNVKLVVDLSKRASTEIKVSSYDKLADPRAFQSEGHLDSLGICIFLAFVKKFNAACPLVVLDDIVTTIDARHRAALCQLIYQNFGDKQLIITTHDNIWNEQLIAEQSRLRIQSSFKNISIVEWNLEGGLRILPYKVRHERIEDKLRAGDKSGAANEIRQYLEWLLKEICENVKAEVAFRSDGRYTVGDLFNPSRKRVEKLIKDCQWKADALTRYSDIETAAKVGNLLSHDNPDVMNISLPEVRAFYDAVRSLHGMFQCDCCQGSIYYDRDAAYIRCISHACAKPLVIQTKK